MSHGPVPGRPHAAVPRSVPGRTGSHGHGAGAQGRVLKSGMCAAARTARRLIGLGQAATHADPPRPHAPVERPTGFRGSPPQPRWTSVESSPQILTDL